MDIEKQILQPIDEALANYRTQDHFMSIESQVWAELDASVKGGWRTEEEAQDAFLEWRTAHRSIGAPAVRSQVETPNTRQQSDNRRRMRRITRS